MATSAVGLNFCMLKFTSQYGARFEILLNNMATGTLGLNICMFNIMGSNL